MHRPLNRHLWHQANQATIPATCHVSNLPLTEQRMIPHAAAKVKVHGKTDCGEGGWVSKNS